MRVRLNTKAVDSERHRGPPPRSVSGVPVGHSAMKLIGRTDCASSTIPGRLPLPSVVTMLGEEGSFGHPIEAPWKTLFTRSSPSYNLACGSRQAWTHLQSSFQADSPQSGWMATLSSPPRVTVSTISILVRFDDQGALASISKEDCFAKELRLLFFSRVGTQSSIEQDWTPRTSPVQASTRTALMRDPSRTRSHASSSAHSGPVLHPHWAGDRMSAGPRD
ncbi:hypothetical protein THAOC_14014 [Thalassiosira oceanica]|uniref:Uncharacterized protein n=1 Tax=Thalassiosira oceanica TaxID=159749 RepID=K0SIN1_THAOC|nr:hypothetical protein THAOC_14014 [Thalassiosira oceanica]|eukprot:EJK65165.1 hypothetical protein THAOC_14014 [Thalassiosira oceanica]